MMQQRSKLPRCLSSCCLPHALQPLGHGCPLPSAVRAWPLDVLLGAVASLPTLRRRLPVFVRIVPRYYLPLRLLGGVRVGRAAGAFPHRPATSRQAPPRSPGSRAGSFLTCRGLRPRRVRTPLAIARRLILPSLSIDKVSTRIQVFRGSMDSPPVPLSTLHPRCRHRRRMTRGQRGSLLLHCGALSSPTPRRFIPALSDSPHFFTRLDRALSGAALFDSTSIGSPPRQNGTRRLQKYLQIKSQ